MSAILFESAVRALLLALSVWLVLRILRIRTASVRHTAWAVVAMVMLSLPAIVVWAPKASIPVLPAQSDVAKPAAARTAVAPRNFEVVVPAGSVAAPPAPPVDWGRIAWAVYLLGLGTFSVRLLIGSARVRALLREAAPRGGMLTHPSCATPITVGWIHPTVILPVDWTEWPEGQQRAVLAHEAEHIRRRDPLFQLLALVNRAVFWFHPLAWWLERHLSELAEEACDAAVLDQGYDPNDYSYYLLELARNVQRRGVRVATLGMAMPGDGLGQRIRQILTGVRAPRITLFRLATTRVLCLAAAVAFAAGQLAHSQPPPEFEVATIKPTAPDAKGSWFRLNPGGQLSITNMTLLEIIRFSYADGLGSMLEISGGPDWIRKDKYDVEAKAEGSPGGAQYRLMLRPLLAERFGLKVHRESKEVDVYNLVLARDDGKLGPKMTDWDGLCNGNEPQGKPESEKVPRCRAMFGPEGLSVVGLTMPGLADVLSAPITNLGRPVVDRTGVSGYYSLEFNFKFQPPNPGGAQIPSDPLAAGDGPSLFTALQEQLGVKLQPGRGNIDLLVVDHVDRPTEN